MLREALYCKKAVSDLLLVIYIVFVPVEFHKVPMYPFLWAVCVPLNGIPKQGEYQYMPQPDVIANLLKVFSILSSWSQMWTSTCWNLGRVWPHNHLLLSRVIQPVFYHIVVLVVEVQFLGCSIWLVMPCKKWTGK